MTSDARTLVGTLRTLHGRLAATVLDLTPEQLRTRSYATEWSIADVLSHLGSASEQALMALDDPDGQGPGQEEMASVWAMWGTRTPEQQAAESVATTERWISRLEQLDDGALEALHRNIGEVDLDAAEVLRLRVAEHAMHSWDVAVALDDTAVVPAEGVPAMLDLLPFILRFAAQPHDDVLRVDVRTTDPERAMVLDLQHGETRVLPASSAGAGRTDGSLELPAEAFLRMVYGRLDARHTPPLKASDDALLVRLREIFRGF
jgi:uncharacterized protein (TIGR03083 family)